MNLDVSAFSLPPGQGYPFFITAKRYRRPRGDALDPGALTLICLHSTSFHKETWEPTLDVLFQADGSFGQHRIAEAWAIECPNHGASAQLNEAALTHPLHKEQFSCRKYGLAAYRFITSTAGLKDKRLVCLGHSLGAVAATFLFDIVPRITFYSLVLVEPMISPGGIHHLYPLSNRLVSLTLKRRDEWPNRDAALASFRGWHPRVAELYVAFGLRDHPRGEGATLACTRGEEAAMYRDLGSSEAAVALLNAACVALPVHLILGAVHDYLPPQVHADLAGGRPHASISTLQGLGHLIPQHAPDRLSAAVFAALFPDRGSSRL
ncbi:Alpha/beta hydrolase fold-1 [Amylostereum chailletii]|nr:Alpha/beta hydrolase fold-1 [Amylostereum chailletii]